MSRMLTLQEREVDINELFQFRSNWRILTYISVSLYLYRHIIKAETDRQGAFDQKFVEPLGSSKKVVSCDAPLQGIYGP